MGVFGDPCPDLAFGVTGFPAQIRLHLLTREEGQGSFQENHASVPGPREPPAAPGQPLDGSPPRHGLNQRLPVCLSPIPSGGVSFASHCLGPSRAP